MDKKLEAKLQKIYQMNQERFDKKLERILRQGLPKLPGQYYSSCELKLDSLAKYRFVLDNDVVGAKQYFYNVSIAVLKKIQWFDKHKDEVPVSNNLSMSNFYGIIWALLSDDFDLALKIAELLGGRDKFDKQDIPPYTYNLGYLFKYVMMDNYENATEFLKEIKNKSQKFSIGFENALEGILAKDSILLQAGLEEMVNLHKKDNDNKGTVGQFVSVPVIAMSKLAEFKGVEYEFKSELAPYELIAETNYIRKQLDVFN